MGKKVHEKKTGCNRSFHVPLMIYNKSTNIPKNSISSEAQKVKKNSVKSRLFRAF